MESLIRPAILKLEQWGLFYYVQNLLLQMLWIEFCGSGMLWEVCVDL